MTQCSVRRSLIPVFPIYHFPKWPNDQMLIPQIPDGNLDFGKGLTIYLYQEIYINLHMYIYMRTYFNKSAHK